MEKSFMLSDEFINSYRLKPEPFGFNGLGKVTFYRTYSRQKPDGSMETWVDVCRRVVEWMYSIQKNNAHSWDEEKGQRSAEEAFDRMFNFKWTPSGRGLWMAGSDFLYERKHIEAMQNCAFISTLEIKPNQGAGDTFGWIMNMLMFGVGVGLDVRGAGRIPVYVPLEQTWIYKIPDSREGWVKSLELLIDSYTKENQSSVTFDYSDIRPKGAPITGFGGTSSGYEPLAKLHERVRKVLSKRAIDSDNRLTVQDIADIANQTGACVVAGNVRRSAEIILGNSTQQFLDLKEYGINPDRQAWGWASNNTVIAENGEDYKEIARRIKNNGEPGLFWQDNVTRYGRMGEQKFDPATGTNPCFVPGTMVQTKTGHYPIEELVGKTVEIWDGNKWVKIDNFRMTAENQELMTMVLQDGSTITATPYHSFILENGDRLEMQDIVPGDRLMISNAPKSHGSVTEAGAYLKGFLIGDGTIKKETKNPVLWIYDGKQMCCNRLYDSANEIVPIINTNAIEEIEFRHKMYGRRNLYNMTGLSCRSNELSAWAGEYKTGLPSYAFEWSLESKANFLAGLFDADGNVIDTKNGFGYQLSSVNKKLLLDVQLLLKTMGIHSKLGVMKKAGTVDFNDGYGEYEAKECYRLTLSQANSIEFARIAKFERLVDFSDREVAYSMKPRFNTVVDIYYEDYTSDVYCCTVPTNHSFVLSGMIRVGQCGEQPLESREMCNLVEIYINNADSLQDLRRTIKFAYLYAKSVTVAYNDIGDEKTRNVMLRNRRIGLSLTGITQFLARHSVEELREWMDTGYREVQRYDMVYSEWLGINESIRTTTIKPSGTVSLLAGSTPGVHFPISEYYIRRIRIADTSPLLGPIMEAGFYVEDDVYSDNTKVIEFPVFVGHVRSESDVSPWEQLKIAALAQRHWSDNGVSVTVTFDPKQTSEDNLAAMLEHYRYELKSVSFLPRGGVYEQMPYEPITKERYESMVERIKEIDFSFITNAKDSLDLYCDGDACIIPV